MHYEYAVEPAAIGSSWERFLYLIEKFGFQEGRLISRFPRDWARQVLDAAREADVRDVAYKNIVEKLREKKQVALIKTGRDFDETLDSWLENAMISHAKRPFHAIVARKEISESSVVSPDELDADHPLMTVPRSRDVPRTAEDLARACSLLLRTAREINLVDPYFDLAKGSYREPLREMMSSLQAAGKDSVTIRIHYRDHDSRPHENEILRNAKTWVKGMMPDGYEIRLYAWQEHENGEDLHDRYLLCDRGGMMIGAGFEAFGPQETATIALLEDAHAQELLLRFADGAKVYDQVGNVVRIRANGDADLIR